MGLITETITTHVPVGRVCTDGSSSSTFEDVGSFDRTIYRVFSMQDDMKILNEPVRTRNEFDLFVTYAVGKTNGTLSDTNFDSLNDYLGTIGVTNGIC